jgi:tagatose-1,6-bisphosphate aldolase
MKGLSIGKIRGLQQLETVNMVAKECIKYDLPFLVEPKSYPIGEEISNPREFAILREQLVIKTVGADRLKRLSEIASKYAVPWYQKFGMTSHELAHISERWYEEY